MLNKVHNPDILTCISSLRSDEVFTPPKVVNNILDQLPNDIWKNEEIKFLDPVSKSGVFLREITKRLIIGLEKKIPNLEYSIIYIEEFPSIAKGCQNYKTNIKINKDDIATIMLTTGTTDLPKAVQLTYNNFESSCNNWNNFLNFNNKDNFLCCLPIHHIGGLAVLVRALIYNFSIHLAESFNSKLLYQLLNKNSITLVSLVPTMLDRIIKESNGLASLKKTRAILLGGGAASESLLNKCLKNKIPIVKTYGMTETCSGIVGLWIDQKPSKKHFSGYPFSDVSIKIINDEIIISGPMVMKGYLNGSESNGIHNSKDIGWMDEEGILFIEMRRKDLIISGGENINPKEVEKILIAIDNISDVCVVGIDDKEWGQKVIAYISLHNPSISLKKEKIKNILLKNLSYYKIPKEFITLKHIPRNEIGKINFNELINL